MKKEILVVLLFATVLLYGCIQPPAQKEETIKIGVIAPLTGPFAEWGNSINDGVKLALEDSNHKFAVSFEDDACNPTTAVTIANKFFSVDNIRLIIGPGCVDCLRAIAPLADEKQALLFSTGLLDDNVFEETHSTINLAAQISTESEHMAAYMHSEGIKKVAVVHGTNFFGQEFGKQFPKFLAKFGIELTSIQPTALDATDFRTVILKIAETNPDAIFIHQGEKPMGIFLKQLREFGNNTPVYSYYGTEQESVKQAAGDSLEGVKYTYPVNSAEGSAEKQSFESRYKKEFNGQLPSATSFFVYDGIMLLDKAMNECKQEDTNCILEFFKKPGLHHGLSGDFEFRKDGSIFRPFGIKTFKNGEFVWITKKVDIEEKMIEAYILHLFILAGIYAVLAMSLNLITGFAGMLNLGHAAFFAIGAYASTLLVMAGFPFWVGLLAAALIAALFGVLLSIPALRLRGDFLAVATLGFGEIIRSILLNWTDLTRGPLGIPGIPKPEFFGFVFDSLWAYFALVLVVVVVTFFVLEKLLHSRFGISLKAIRESEHVSESLGKDTKRLKIMAFAIGACFAGIAGCFFASYISFIDPSSFTLAETILILLMVVMGGMGSLKGSIIGAIVLIFLPEPLRFIGLPSSMVGQLRQIIYAVLLLIIIIKKPKGLLGEQWFKGIISES